MLRLPLLLALAFAMVPALGAPSARGADTPPEAAAPSREESPLEGGELHAAPTSRGWVRYTYANDLFTSTDYYFTQGMTLTWVDPLLDDSPLALPALDLGPGALRRVRLGWRYDGFTPIEYQEPEIQRGDRPFASYMLVSHHTETTSADGGASFAAGWALGLLGPGAGARQFQSEIHRLTDNKSPRGWRNQIDHDLVAQVEVTGALRLLRHADVLDLQVEAEARAGTLYTNASVGARVRLGWLGDPTWTHDSGRFYLWSALQGRAVAYDATLQGGVFGDSVYTLGSGAVRRVVASGQVGLTLELDTFEFGASLHWISSEFNRGRSHAWGMLALTVHY